MWICADGWTNGGRLQVGPYHPKMPASTIHVHWILIFVDTESCWRSYLFNLSFVFDDLSIFRLILPQINRVLMAGVLFQAEGLQGI